MSHMFHKPMLNCALLREREREYSSIFQYVWITQYLKFKFFLSFSCWSSFSFIFLRKSIIRTNMYHAFIDIDRILYLNIQIISIFIFYYTFYILITFLLKQSGVMHLCFGSSFFYHWKLTKNNQKYAPKSHMFFLLIFVRHFRCTSATRNCFIKK